MAKCYKKCVWVNAFGAHGQVHPEPRVLAQLSKRHALQAVDGEEAGDKIAHLTKVLQLITVGKALQTYEGSRPLSDKSRHLASRSRKHISADFSAEREALYAHGD